MDLQTAPVKKISISRIVFFFSEKNLVFSETRVSKESFHPALSLIELDKCTFSFFI